MSLSPVENDDSNEEGQDDGCEDSRCRDPTAPVWHCVDCDSLYCSACWPLQRPHRPDKKGRDGIPHEKLDVHLVRQLRTILTPQGNIEKIRSLHEKDQRNKWFGVARDLSGQPILEDYGRYAALMAEMGIASRQYPQLVSFIGVTNAGKSSLIKMLIHHNGGSATSFPSPVVGSTAHGSEPTSGDVHLYGDPSTCRERLPILYADCEGFEGGESTPLGSLSRKCSRSLARVQGAWGEPVFQSRPIRWATTAESRQREYTVTALYPRLLYTFSDCIVFVLRNPKTFQSASLRKLLDWGASALEMSLNQPALPHCVAVLTSGEPGIPEREYDIAVATKTLLATVCDALDPVEGVPRFRELASHWRRLGRHISTVEDLINCYYRSFAVVRVPAQPQYKLISDQIRKLHGTLQLNCVQSSLAKQRARMLIGADDIDTYLQHGFDHLTTYITIPFNFMLVSLQRSPIPSDFGEHILQLCTTLSAHFVPSDVSAASKMFTEVRIMLASCVLLDCARFRRGSPEELFARYEGFFRYAITEYLQLHSPCTYISSDGSRSCVLVRARHLAKGHQDARGIITTGEHVAALD
ncbi:hypothetical protein LTR09_012985 [Extremus antarcticus]|uniref:Uncharacterized protein n=1 Tax=Extremus antarcticus TaxID=702011 RepID=A0AAJ0G8U4_9PEZI|nr:hypothetical protein LTR09_012985 [Extremus antarcticus]